MSGIKRDVNSTEKLLNVIRGKDEESFGGLKKPEVSLLKKKPSKKFKFLFSKSFFANKKYTVGFDISREFICLVKTALNSSNHPVLIDKKIIKISSQLSFGSPEFNRFLKSSIFDFCGKIDNCNIWTRISTSKVNVYFITVPRVPKKQLEKVIFWTAKKEGFIDEEKHIFDFEVQGEVIEQGAPKYSVMFYTAEKEEVEKVKSLVSDIGITLTGITIVPFAIQSIFRSQWMTPTEGIFASLFIGDNYSRIDVYNKENLVMTRGIKTGSTTSMAEAIVSSVLEETGNLKLKQDEARKILFSLSDDSEAVKDGQAGLDFKKEEILEMISPVWKRLARQVDLTLKTSSIGNQKIEKIYILSSFTVDKSILDYISNQLEADTEYFDPFERSLSDAEKSLSPSKRILIAPALGFALSDNNRTPNLMHTYAEKNKEIFSQKFNRFLTLLFIAALVVCLGTLVYQTSKYNKLSKQKDILRKELASYTPLLSKDAVLSSVNEEKVQRDIARKYVQRYFSLAAIGELSNLSMPGVRLISCNITQGTGSSKSGATDKTKEAEKTAQSPQDGLMIEGVVFGEKNTLDSTLGQYVLKLESSPMFSNVTTQKNSVVKFKKNDVLHFTLSAKAG